MAEMTNPLAEKIRENVEYIRECNHGEMLHWKKCAECREYLVRGGEKDRAVELLAILRAWAEKQKKEIISEEKEPFEYSADASIGYNSALSDLLSFLETAEKEITKI